MPAPDANSVDLPIETFGGRVTQYDPQTLPVGASPANQDVIFSDLPASGYGVVAAVGSRPGLGSGFYTNPFAGNPTVNYLKTYVDNTEIFHQLSLDGLGVMRDESPCPTPPGVPSVIGQCVAASLAQSDSLFGREWIAISAPTHPGFGIDIPRQWDGTNFDRVSQCGPGAPPIVSDEVTTQYTIVASPSGLAQPGSTLGSATEVGNTCTIAVGAGPVMSALANAVNAGIPIAVIVSSASQPNYDGTFYVTSCNPVAGTFTYLNPITGISASAADVAVTYGMFSVELTPSAEPFLVGQQVKIAGAGVGGYNGIWTNLYNDVADGLFIVSGNSTVLVNSGNGTVQQAGNIPAGIHQVAVCFVTREGYITKPSPPAQWTAAGTNRVVVGSIPIGPPNIVARIIIFTPVITPPALTGDFYYFDGSVATSSYGTFPSMVINDNVTTTVTLDFLDAVLENATSATYLFNLLELGECASATAYSNRVFWAGERNKIPNLLNVTFDGGFSPGGASPPLGWTLDPTYGAGGGSAVTNGYTPYWGDAYVMTGNGATLNRGMITQGAYQDYLGVPIININVAYSVRVRAYSAGGLVAGNLSIELYSPSIGSIGLFTVPAANLTANYQEFIGILCAAQATLPADLLLRVYAGGTPTNGGSIVADCIEIFPTNTPYNTALIRGSYAGDPESFDQETGYLIPGQLSNESIRTAFTLLDNKLYMITERGLLVTQDDGQNEPASWAINTVSTTVGTGSVRGVGLGESWAIIAARDGVYIFWGSEPVKISQEIQPDWDNINWAYDQTIYVVVDTIKKRIIIGAPTGVSTTPDIEFVCDYSQLANAEGQTAAADIASHPQAYYSVYNPTKVVAPGKARKWTLWNISANCADLALRSNGSYLLLRGNNVGNGKVYNQLASNLNDDENTIESFYQTAYVPQLLDEQALQLGSHRKMCKYLTGYAYGGNGNLEFFIIGAHGYRSVTLSPLVLGASEQWDFEKNVNWVGERFSIYISLAGINTWFVLSKLCPTIQRDIMTPVRGVS